MRLHYNFSTWCIILVINDHPKMSSFIMDVSRHLLSVPHFTNNIPLEFHNAICFFLIYLVITKLLQSFVMSLQQLKCNKNCSDRLIRICIRAWEQSIAFIQVWTTGKNTISEMVPVSLPIGVPRDPIWSIWYSGSGWMQNIQSWIFLNHVSALRHR